MKRWKKITLVASGLMLAFAFAAAWFFLPQLILCPHRYDASNLSFIHHQKPEGNRKQIQELDITTHDGFVLDGLYLPAQSDSAWCTIILVHGIGACKELFIQDAALWAKRGCNVAFFDLRAHGKSGGPYCTYGYFEKMDVSALTDTLQKMNAGVPIGIYGHSLGGAIACQALAYDSRLRFGIIESTFDELQHVVRIYTHHHLGFTCHWLSDFALWRAESLAGFDASTVRPADAARHITQPVWITHGTADKNIPFACGQRIFDSLGSADKHFYPVQNGGHNNVGVIGGSALADAKWQFVLDVLSSPKQ